MTGQHKRFIKKLQLPFTKGLLLYFLPVLAIPATIIAFGKGNLNGIIINASAYALFILAAGLLRRGLINEAQYHEKTVTKAPKWPLKTIAAFIVALATTMLAYLGAGHTLLISAVFGLGGMLGMYFSYGFDPRSEKSVTGNHGYTTEEITRTIDEAEQAITGIEAANSLIRNDRFNQRIENICSIARDILMQIEADPGDIRRARKFLNVYLDGTLKVTHGYAKTHAYADTEVLEEKFRDLLNTIESVFLQQKDKLQEEDTLDLDVRIDVLTTQLKREGII